MSNENQEKIDPSSLHGLWYIVCLNFVSYLNMDSLELFFELDEVPSGFFKSYYLRLWLATFVETLFYYFVVL